MKAFDADDSVTRRGLGLSALRLLLTTSLLQFSVRAHARLA